MCKWIKDEDGIWDTSCENRFEFTVDGPIKNWFVFCPFCGEQIIEVEYNENA